MNFRDTNIIFYDGYCNLCNTTLQFIVKRDKQKVFQYYTLQSKEADLLLSKRFVDRNIPDSVILLSEGKLYTRSEAIFKILPKLGKGYQILLVFRIIPKKFRDRIYDWIASNRYKWFGKKEHCQTNQDTIV